MGKGRGGKANISNLVSWPQKRDLKSRPVKTQTQIEYIRTRLEEIKYSC